LKLPTEKSAETPHATFVCAVESAETTMGLNTQVGTDRMNARCREGDNRDRDVGWRSRGPTLLNLMESSSGPYRQYLDKSSGPS